MLLSRRHGLIFFACGKTGTTSIERALADLHDGHDELTALERAMAPLRADGRRYNPKHTRPELARQVLDPALWARALKVCFVRNPFDWVLSQYCFNFRRGQPRQGLLLQDHHVHQVRDKLQVNNQSHRVDYLQVDFACDRDGRRIVDVVGRYERLQDDLDGVLARLGLAPRPLPRLNATDHGHYRDHYTPGARAAVERIYRLDLDAFNYAF